MDDIAKNGHGELNESNEAIGSTESASTGGMSRRSFLTGMALGGVGLAASGVLASCSTPASSNSASGSASDSTEAPENEASAVVTADETVDADIVVVGSGISGLAAAVEASEAGAKVVVLESQGVLGGNSNYAEGIVGVGTQLQKDLGITDINVKEVLGAEYLFQNYNVNPKLWEIVMSNSADNIQWLMDHGVKFTTVTAPGGQGAKTWHLYDGPEHKLGSTVVDHLSERAEGNGTTFALDTKATALLTDNGSVVGVQAETKDGTIIDYNAKAVVIASGGMAYNYEALEQLTNRDTSNLQYNGTLGCDGSGAKMVEDMGAGRIKNVTICMVGVVTPGTGLGSQLGVSGAMEQGNLWLNQDGVRFINEDIVTHYTRGSNAIQSQAHVYSFYDQDVFDRLVSTGVTNGWGAYVTPGSPCDKIEAELEQYADSEDIVVADTLDELAAAFNLDPEVMKASIDEYNEFCAAGEDAQYGKAPEFLNPVARAPFYGFRIVANNLNTMGGISINTKCQVLNESHEVIPNLYAAGNDCSGLSGETYGISIPGSNQGISLCTGRIAGQQAASSIS